MESNRNENSARLRGIAGGQPVFSHETHGERFYTFPLEVKRLSGIADMLNVVAPGPLAEPDTVRPGGMLEITGELRSFNNKSGKGNRLVITVFAKEVKKTDELFYNYILLSGSLCKAPVFRRTPLGRDICDLMLAVNRKYGRADYLPCIAWGQLAAETKDLDVGAMLRLEGRVQSRSYVKTENGESRERTAYEVSVMKLLGPEEEQN